MTVRSDSQSHTLLAIDFETINFILTSNNLSSGLQIIFRHARTRELTYRDTHTHFVLLNELNFGVVLEGQRHINR